MSGLRFPQPLLGDRQSQMLADRSRESCAIGYATYNPSADAWVVQDVELVPDEAYEQRDGVSAVLSPAYLVSVANKARPAGYSVVLMHTHPWAEGTPDFSQIDDAGEVSLAEYLGRRAPAGNHLALVVGPHGCRARRLGEQTEVPVWEIGSNVILRSAQATAGMAGLQHERQVRAFGEPGQRLLRSLRVAVVGAGGTGSVTVQQLAHLGVDDFLIIDPDVVEETNLNRLVGSRPTDVGEPKVLIAERAIRAVRPGACVTTLTRDVVDADVAPLLAAVDFIFLCTDSHASRAVVNQIAYQHLVPVIDMGVSITVRGGAVSHITGRTQMLAPTLTCLVCTEALDGEQIRREMLTPEQRASDPYVQGVHEPQPAVVSINSTMASLAVTMFLGAVTPVPAASRFQLYDGVRGAVRPTAATAVEHCIVCSSSGALAKGVAWPLPVRPLRAAHG